MALYKDGNPVSGLNSIPRLTLAQYNTLNVKPEFWIRTDAPEEYGKISADEVSYDSNNTVKDKIDGMIESGSNTNGSWIKYADGTMICTKTVDAGNRLFANAWGSLYEATEGVDFGNWAMEFYAKPIVSLCLVNAGGACFFGNLSNPSNTYIGACGLSRPNQATIPVVVDIVGIGRWKA